LVRQAALNGNAEDHWREQIIGVGHYPLAPVRNVDVPNCP
jgi:hypothetical protein